MHVSEGVTPRRTTDEPAEQKRRNRRRRVGEGKAAAQGERPGSHTRTDSNGATVSQGLTDVRRTAQGTRKQDRFTACSTI